MGSTATKQKNGVCPSEQPGARVTDYLGRFGLREAPFGLTPDPAYLFACRAMREALKAVLTAIVNGEAIAKVTGEVGTGKTLLSRKVLSMLGGGWVSIWVPNPSFDPRTLYVALAEGVGVAAQRDLDQHSLFKAITRALLERARQGKRVLICIDEAQSMPEETLEALRLLTNLETEKRKLVQVAMFGQPELDEKLASPALRQLLQRITFQHRMDGLDEGEVGAYVAHRMAVAGRAVPFQLAAPEVRRIHALTSGIPRLINVLMSKALQLAHAAGIGTVGRSQIDEAAASTPALNAEPHTFMADARVAPVPSSGGAIDAMLAEMDRRAPLADAGRERKGAGFDHEWFWRVVATLLVIAVGWVAWVAYQLQPVEGLVTELAYRAAEEARMRQSAGSIGPGDRRTSIVPPAEAGAHVSDGQKLRLEHFLRVPVLDPPAKAAD